jgi:hypothetical protein
MAFCLILVREAIITKLTFVWFLHTMHPKTIVLVGSTRLSRLQTYFSSSMVSNFFGFFGQHLQMKAPFSGLVRIAVFDSIIRMNYSVMS